VFCTPSGEALSGSSLSSYHFPALLARAGLPRIRFHDLRHTCATVLLRRGIHPKIGSESLGHATVSMTLDRYSHVLPAMQQAARPGSSTATRPRLARSRRAGRPHAPRCGRGR
jgi:integrase